MVFVSLEYALLLMTAFVAVWLLPAWLTPWLLLAASIIFYAWWSVPHLALVGASIAVGLAAGLAIAAARRRERQVQLVVS